MKKLDLWQGKSCHGFAVPLPHAHRATADPPNIEIRTWALSWCFARRQPPRARVSLLMPPGIFSNTTRTRSATAICNNDHELRADALAMIAEGKMDVFRSVERSGTSGVLLARHLRLTKPITGGLAMATHKHITPSDRTCALCGKTARNPMHFVLLGEICRREGVELQARDSNDFHNRCARAALARMGGAAEVVHIALSRIRRRDRFTGDVVAIVPANRKSDRRTAK